MGNINTLKNFIYWAKEKYSYCTKNSLILWNHGAGLYSEYKHPVQSRIICSDEESGGLFNSLDNVIYMGELKKLLTSIYPQDKKLDFLGFDSCLMGMYEIFYQFRDCVKYMAAAPSTNLGGWNYEYMFSHENSTESGKNFAINVVDGYTKAYKGTYPNSLTAVDLQYVKDLKTNIDKIATEIDKKYKNMGIGYKISFENIKKSYAYYGNYFSDGETQDRLLYPHYDLGSVLDVFSEKTNSSLTSNEIIQAAKAARETLSNMVLKTWVSHKFVKIPGYNKGDIYGANQPYGVSIFLSDSLNFPTQGFYTDKTYETKGVLGYGGIEAASSSADGKVNTWYELLVDFYGDNLAK